MVCGGRFGLRPWRLSLARLPCGAGGAVRRLLQNWHAAVLLASHKWIVVPVLWQEAIPILGEKGLTGEGACAMMRQKLCWCPWRRKVFSVELKEETKDVEE